MDAERSQGFCGWLAWLLRRVSCARRQRSIRAGSRPRFGSLFSFVRLTTNQLSAVGIVLSSAAIVGGLTIWTWSDFAQARRNAEVNTTAAAVAIGDTLHWSLIAIGGLVEPLRAKIEAGGSDKLSEKQLADLRRFARYLPEMGQIFVCDEDGNVIAAEPRQLPLSLNLSDREWFRALRDGTSGIYIGRAVKGRVFRDLVFPVAVSIRRPDGAFLGALEIRVGMDYLAHLINGLGVGPGATVGLYRARDGALVGRSPMTEAQLDATIATLPYFSELTNSNAQSWLGWIQHEGHAQLAAVRRLNHWPLIVSVSLTKTEIYSSARRRLLLRSAIAVLLLAGLMALIVLGARQAWREAMLMGELEHRVKNAFSSVEALIDRALEDNPSSHDVLFSLRGRIQTMALTQKLLGRGRWKRVSLGDLIRLELKPYATRSNVTVEGPHVHLSPDASRAVGMVIHELATNAAKYGALSRSTGQVHVRWTLTPEQAPAPALRIEWNETGGPAAPEPTRQGYGSEVIRDVLTYEFGGRVDVAFADEGLRCMIELPASPGIVV